jgi:hypothetical protein
MLPLYLARIEDLGHGDLLRVDCAACHHVAPLTPEFLLRLSGSALGPRCLISSVRGRGFRVVVDPTLDPNAPVRAETSRHPVACRQPLTPYKKNVSAPSV